MSYEELRDNAKMCAKSTDNSYEKGMILGELAKAEATVRLAKAIDRLGASILDGAVNLSVNISSLGDKLER